MKRDRSFLTTAQLIPVKKRKLSSSHPNMPVTAPQVRRMIANKEETKYFVAGIVSDGILVTGSISSLTNIVQGTGFAQRLGDEVQHKELRVKYAFNMADTTQLVRVIFFKWKDNDQFNAPTVAQILLNDTGGAPSPMSFLNDNCKQSYTILFDKTYSGTNNAANPKSFINADFKIPLKGKSRYFSDAGTTGTNKIYRLFISDSVAPPNPNFDWQTQIAYSDS